MATRCRWPPESCLGLRSSRGVSSSISAASAIRVLHLVLGHLPQLEAVADVVGHAHVRVERVGLEHHRDVAALGVDVVHAAAADAELAGGDVLEARDHAEGRGLAAARRADEDQELAVLDVDD